MFVCIHKHVVCLIISVNIFFYAVDCDPGREGVGGKCEPCQRGYYKDVKGATKCTLCDNGKITRGPGATLFSDCSIGMCFIVCHYHCHSVLVLFCAQLV